MNDMSRNVERYNYRVCQQLGTAVSYGMHWIASDHHGTVVSFGFYRIGADSHGAELAVSFGFYQIEVDYHCILD